MGEVGLIWVTFVVGAVFALGWLLFSFSFCYEAASLGAPHGVCAHMVAPSVSWPWFLDFSTESS